jgi:hypothetical protein
MPELRDSRTVPRRSVSYTTLDAVVADADRLVAARATTTGNWSLAQILEHLATALDYQVDGFPPELQFGRVMKWLCRTFFKRRILEQGMVPGFKLKGPAATALIREQSDVELADALEHLKSAVGRLKAAARVADHGAFGPLTRAEAELLHRRHAELHMSFVAEPA